MAPSTDSHHLIERHRLVPGDVGIINPRPSEGHPTLRSCLPGGPHVQGGLAVVAAEVAIEMGEITEAGFEGDRADSSVREAGIA